MFFFVLLYCVLDNDQYELTDWEIKIYESCFLSELLPDKVYKPN